MLWLSREIGDRVRSRLTGAVVQVPHLLDLEVLSALRRLAAVGAISGEAAGVRVGLLKRADVVRHAHGPLLRRVWGLRDQMTPYEAIYVALAEALGIPLVTTDRRLAGVAKTTCEVELL